MLKNNNSNTGNVDGDVDCRQRSWQRHSVALLQLCALLDCARVYVCVCVLLRKKVVKNNCGKPKKAQKTENENAAAATTAAAAAAATTTTQRQKLQRQQRLRRRRLAAELPERVRGRAGNTLLFPYPFLPYDATHRRHVLRCVFSSLAFLPCLLALRAFLLIRFFFD